MEAKIAELETTIPQKLAGTEATARSVTLLSELAEYELPWGPDDSPPKDANMTPPVGVDLRRLNVHIVSALLRRLS